MKLFIEINKNNQKFSYIIYNNKKLFLTSQYNPEKENQRRIKKLNISDNSLIIIYGNPLNYFFSELYKKFPDNFFIVIEYFQEFYNLVEPKNNIKKFNNINDLTFFLEKLDINLFKHIIRIRHPAENNISLLKEFYDKFDEKINKWVDKKASFTITEKVFADIWGKNFNKNLKLIENNKFSDKIKLDYKKICLVTAGPSVDEHIEKIKNEYDCVFCTDTVFPLLCYHNIPVKLVLSIDPQKQSIEHFKKGFIFKKQIDDLFIAGITVSYPEIFNFKTKKIIFRCNYPEEIKYNLKKFESLDTSSGNVSGALLDLIKKLNIKKYDLFGFDFCFSENYKYHCKGTIYEGHNARQLNKFNTFDNIDLSKITIWDYYENNKKILLNKQLKLYRSQFSQLSNIK